MPQGCAPVVATSVTATLRRRGAAIRVDHAPRPVPDSPDAAE